MAMTDRDRLRHLMIELEWADRQHPRFVRALRQTEPAAQAAIDCEAYIQTLPTEWT